MFISVMNTRITGKDNIIVVYKEAIRVLTDNEALNAEAINLQDECDVVLEMMRQMVRENARAVQDQTEYQRKYSAIVERYARQSQVGRGHADYWTAEYQARGVRAVREDTQSP